MTADLRKLMLEHNFCSEAELFCSDLHFKMFDFSKDNRYKGQSGAMKHEDAIENLVSKLKYIKSRYGTIFEDLSGKDPQSHAVALYLATYFDNNGSSKAYFKEHKKS
jgi:hypothetical protein